MRAVAVIVAHELVEGVLQGTAAGAVAAEGHAPVLLQDGALQPLDAPVGPGMRRHEPTRRSLTFSDKPVTEACLAQSDRRRARDTAAELGRFVCSACPAITED